MGELCAWCKNAEALPYERYNGCCGLHCRDLMEYDNIIDQKEARIRELEDAIRKFLETDMELDDKLSYGVGVEQSPNLYQAVKKAKRGFLDIMPLSEKSDKEK